MRFPIKWGIAYSIFTFLLYLFGVWKYPSTNRVELILLVAIYNLAMFSGFIYGTKKIIHLSFGNMGYEKWKTRFDSTTIVWRFYYLCFWITLVLLIPRFVIYTGYYRGINISEIISKIKFNISDVNQAYMNSHSSGNSVTGIWKIINFFCVLTSGFTWCYTPMVVALWKKIKKSHKVFAITYWIIYCIQYILSATNSGIVGQIFYIAVSWAFVIVYRRYKLGEKSKYGKKEKRRIIVISIAAVVLILSIFGYAMSSRVGVNYRAKNIGVCHITYDEESIFNIITPKPFQSTLAVADSYLTQGYCALEMSFDLPWEPTFLLGNSRFLMSNFAELTGINIFNSTYQKRLYETKGWHYDIYWHTAYLWLANDFSLLFLPIVLFFLFAFFGNCWKRFIAKDNIFGLLGVVLFAQFMFYISANNNLFSLADTLMAFVIVVVLINISDKYDWETISIC